MSDTHNHGAEISPDTYTTVMRPQFNLESLGDRLHKIEDATTIMKDKWRRGDETMRDFTALIDNRLPASVDDNLPHSHMMKSQPDFHSRVEKDQLVEGVYKALETTEERLDGRCDDIYFPMDLSVSALTSKIEAIQRDLAEIQSYIARRPEASASIDRRNNKSTDIH
ncbi:hypothetical protein F2Q69_00047204 [Brassica cretica]|uniref:Uncharacterized protein n=1 Tax=Brassica cretica TaxID=69181 RepID=A0A8S9PQC1_BRACR|nr:hypothetical protein F2Q69_00047204 [Brassica cretica]